MEGSLIIVINVIKPLQDPVISNIIKEHIAHKNLTNIIKLVKYVHKGEVSKLCAREKPNQYNHELSGKVKLQVIIRKFNEVKSCDQAYSFVLK